MFLKAFVKRSGPVEDWKTHYRLVESYRAGGGVRHRNVLRLGELAELPHIEQKRLLGERVTELVKHARNSTIGLFPCGDAAVEALAQRFFCAIRDNGRLDLPAGKDYQNVDIDSVENRDVREVGAEWLCKQALDQLDVRKVFDAHGWGDGQKRLALTHIVSRACHPASELGTCKWIRANSAVCEVTGLPVEKVTKDALYKASLLLHGIKDGLESHLGPDTHQLGR